MPLENGEYPVFHKFPFYEAAFAYSVGHDDPYSVAQVKAAMDDYISGNYIHFSDYRVIDILPTSPDLAPPTVEEFYAARHASLLDPARSRLTYGAIDSRFCSPASDRGSADRGLSLSPTPGASRVLGGVFSTQRFAALKDYEDREEGSPTPSNKSRKCPLSLMSPTGSVSTFHATPEVVRSYLEHHVPTPVQSPALADPKTPTPAQAQAPAPALVPAPVPAAAANAAPAPASHANPADDYIPTSTILGQTLHGYLFHHGFCDQEVYAVCRIVRSIHSEINPIAIQMRLWDVMKVRIPDCPHAPQWFYNEVLKHIGSA